MQRLSHKDKAIRSLLGAGLILWLLPVMVSQAADDDMWQLCKPLDVLPLPPAIADEDKAPVRISADKAITQQDKGLTLEGDVRIQQGRRLLQADRVDYSEQQGEFKADGNVLFRNESFQLNSKRAAVNIKSEQGVYDETRYQYTPRHATGEAKRMTSTDGEHHQLDQVTYTTCDADNVVWKMKADRIELDQAANQGYAHDIALYLKGVPIFYFPYLRFPISEERMSGFLFPEFSTNNNTFDVAVPYYWNIAPNYDMTITPHFISRRGVMLEDEFRYLTQNSRGTLDFEYLPNDLITGEDRGRVSYDHNSSLGRNWNTTAELNYVSESSYYTDMGQDFDLSRTPYLRNTLGTTYNGSRWNFTGRAEAYQTLAGDQPYQRMPQLILGYKPAGNNRLNILFESEYNNFYSADKPTTGSRLDTVAGFSYPYTSTAAFVTPRLTWHTTQYQLEDSSSIPSTSSPTRDLPVFSLDSGIYLERSLADNTLVQTLEPRLYYLYVPYVDQSGLPNFDSSAYTFDFNQLFRENRFAGSDRIGDANQVTVAATSRFLSTASGREYFNISLGQILYFVDRQVTLDGGIPETADSSNYVAEMNAWLSQHWQWRSTLLWDATLESAEQFNNRLQYKPDNAHIVNIDHRSTSSVGLSTLSQLDLSALWRLNSRWHIYGRYYYDLQNDESLDTMYGFGYESCCWALRFTQRDYRPSSGAQLQSGWFMEFEFKGLASAGGRTDSLLKSGILGYESKPR